MKFCKKKKKQEWVINLFRTKTFVLLTTLFLISHKNDDTKKKLRIWSDNWIKKIGWSIYLLKILNYLDVIFKNVIYLLIMEHSKAQTWTFV